MVLDKIQEYLDMLFNGTMWAISTVFGAILTAIGFPKSILMFITSLVVIDVIVKHYSIVMINYHDFTFENYLKAWDDRKLTSRGMKNGLGIKAIFYLPILYMAHQASVLPEIIYGNVISNTLYSFLALIEGRSIIENAIDCGRKDLIPIKIFLKGKQDDLFKGGDN